MDPKAIKEILNSDSESLLNIIDSYQNYHPITVLLTYAELKKRNFDFDDFPKKVEKLNNFSSENKNSNIDDLLSSVLKQNGYNSYQEALEKEPEMILPSKNKSVKSDPQKTSRTESWYQKPSGQVLIGILVFVFLIRIIIVLASNSNSHSSSTYNDYSSTKSEMIHRCGRDWNGIPDSVYGQYGDYCSQACYLENLNGDSREYEHSTEEQLKAVYPEYNK